MKYGKISCANPWPYNMLNINRLICYFMKLKVAK